MGEVTEMTPKQGEIGDKVVETFSLSLNGVTVELSSLGASIARFLVPSADEGTDDIVLGLQSPKDMILTQNPTYFGVIVGRVANRIAKGSFELQETMYVLETNNMPNHLHGGSNGFSRRIWDAAIVDVGTGETQEAPSVSEYPEAPSSKGVMFSLLSEDGDQGYPGEVLVTATYSLQSSQYVDDDRCGVKLCLEMKASLQGTKPTPINLAQHSYFNLSRHDDPNGILDHKLTLHSDAYTPVDNVNIPTREVRSLKDDPVMDWRQGRTFREALAEYGVTKAGLTRQQAEEATGVSRSVTDVSKSAANSDTPDAPYGYDHNYVLRRDNTDASGLNVVGTLEHFSSGRRLTVRTDAPGVQLYTANYLDGGASVPSSKVCKNAAIYGQWQGVCLETQHYPDSLPHGGGDEANKFQEFAAGKCIILRPEEPDYKHRVEYDVQYQYTSGAATRMSNGAAFFRGSDSEGRQYDSIEEMWECQGVLPSDGDAADVSTWYDRAAQYYEENCPANLDGVLGGFANITDLDLEGSKRFIRELEALDPSFRWSSGAAAECGAGIGRVTKGLLISLGVPQCDLIESSARLIAAAPEYLGDSVGQCKCRYFCLGLQEWYPSASTFSMIWIQWVFCYLTDEDAVAFLKRCAESLVEGGVIVLKENTCDKDDDFIVDMDDASVTRSVPYLIQLAEKAGLRLRLQTLQDDFPDEIYPVPMLALEVDPTK